MDAALRDTYHSTLESLFLHLLTMRRTLGIIFSFFVFFRGFSYKMLCVSDLVKGFRRTFADSGD